MVGLICCVVALVGTLLLGRRSLVAGLGGVLTVGYFYGILRANFLDTFTYFCFDCAVAGFYAAQGVELIRRSRAARLRPLATWLAFLLGWVLVMFLLPMQALLIQLVGLRGNTFLVPFVLVGALLTGRQLGQLVLWLAVLNGAALAFAVAEFFLGVPAFYPENAVTEIIYRSRDVAGYTAFRIPATFANAHSYAGTMVYSLPWLVGGLVQPRLGLWRRGLLVGGTGAAVLGIFLTATRVSIIQLSVLMLVATVSMAAATFSGRLRAGYLVVWVLLLAAVGYVVAGEERLQRFATLKETDEVGKRLHGSVNMHFWELLTVYPMGNGLGAGGTSIPHFLQHLIVDPVLMENEYSRILLEQGLVGLALWVAFAGWVLTRRGPPPQHPWRLCWRLNWWGTLGNFGLALLGTGLMTAIPGSVLVFLSMGFIAAGRPAAEPRPGPEARPAGGARERAAAPARRELVAQG
jgi:hypothetical protein